MVARDGVRAGASKLWTKKDIIKVTCCKALTVELEAFGFLASALSQSLATTFAGSSTVAEGWLITVCGLSCLQ